MRKLSKTKILSALILSIPLLLIVYKLDEKRNPVLEVEGGKIQGLASETAGVYIYRGIPFAAPPIGNLRWKAPRKVIPWEGVRLADTFGPPAYQAKHEEGSFYQKEFFFDGDPPYSEDCLFLNIWTPAPGKSNQKLPVAMWIHGGGYVAGWGFEPEMDGEAWAERGVILVTINYRLGIFGFMAHPELSAENPAGISGNYGILDQIAALKWIKNNIAQFGGDPDNIMVFGQSAGANSVKQLVASPLSRELMASAVIMSGGGLSPQGGPMKSDSLDEAEEKGKNMMDIAGLDGLDKMRSASTEEIFGALQGYADSMKQWPRWGPVIDGSVIPQSFEDAACAGQIADIPYMIGFTMDDFGSLADKGQIIDFCELRKEQGGKAFAYQFARPLPGDSAGAFHSSDLWFVFHTLDRSWRPFTEGDAALSETMVDAWTNFSKYGDPNDAGGKSWQASSKSRTDCMVFKLDENGLEASEMRQPLPRR